MEPASCPSLTRGRYAYDFGDTARTTPLLRMYTLGNGFIPSANQLGVLDKKSPGKGGVPGQKKKEGGIGNSINYLLNLKQPIKEEVTIFLKYCEPVPKLIDRVQERPVN